MPRSATGTRLLEGLDDPYARRGTILASQLPVEHRHDVVGDPTFGDASLQESNLGLWAAVVPGRREAAAGQDA